MATGQGHGEVRGIDLSHGQQGGAEECIGEPIGIGGGLKQLAETEGDAFLEGLCILNGLIGEGEGPNATFPGVSPDVRPRAFHQRWDDGSHRRLWSGGQTGQRSLLPSNRTHPSIIRAHHPQAIVSSLFLSFHSKRLRVPLGPISRPRPQQASRMLLMLPLSS